MECRGRRSPRRAGRGAVQESWLLVFNRLRALGERKRRRDCESDDEYSRGCELEHQAWQRKVHVPAEVAPGCKYESEEIGRQREKKRGGEFEGAPVFSAKGECEERETGAWPQQPPTFEISELTGEAAQYRAEAIRVC